MQHSVKGLRMGLLGVTELCLFTSRTISAQLAVWAIPSTRLHASERLYSVVMSPVHPVKRRHWNALNEFIDN